MKIMKISVRMIGIIVYIFCIMVRIESRGSTKKDLIGVKLKGAAEVNLLRSQDLEPAAATFILNKEIGNGFGTHSGISSGSSSGVQRFRGAGFGNVASSGQGFNYPTKYSIGSVNKGTLDDEIEFHEFDDVDSNENLGEDEEVGYNGGVGNLVLGGLPQGGLGYGISKGGLGLTSSLGNGVGVGISNLGGLTKNLGGGTLTLIPEITSGDVELIGGDIHTDNSYKKAAGSKSVAEEEEVAAAEAAKGYKVAEEFDKAEKGQVENTHHAGHYDAATGSKKGELDEVKKYSESDAAVKGEKGEAFEKSAGHKKGHKTTGYHNVYHKDEYKKDTSFYDDEHVSAHQEAFGTESSRHSEAKGAHEKVEKIDKEFHEAEEAKKGTFTNGHQYGVAQGHDREQAQKEHYEKAADFAKEENHKAEKEEASSSGSSHKGF